MRLEKTHMEHIMYLSIRRKLQFVCHVTYLFKNLMGAEEPFLQLSKVLTSDRVLTTWAKPYVNPITDGSEHPVNGNQPIVSWHVVL